MPFPGPVALVGSGEYLPELAEVEAGLLRGRPPRYVQLPTGAGLEGERSVRYWVDLGRAQAERLGVEAVPLLVLDRASADDPAIAEQVAGAGLVYLSGGDPPHVAATLINSAVWAAVEQAWQNGAALAGCSAGAMAMTDWVPHPRRRDRAPLPGLAVVPRLRVIPHFDRMMGWMPDLAEAYARDLPDGVSLVGIDEGTALVNPSGDRHHWVVEGRQSVWLIQGDGREQLPAGTEVTLEAA